MNKNINVTFVPAQLWFALATFMIVSALTVFLFLKFLDANTWLLHTHKVIERLEDATQHLVTIESEARGYAISGDSNYLQDFAKIAGLTRADMESIRQLTSDNPQQQQLIAGLAKLSDERINSSKRMVAARRNIREVTTDKQLLENFKTGSGQMAAFRQIEQQMIGNEQELLRERSAKLRELSRIAVALIVAFALLAVAFVIWSFRRTQRLYHELQVREASVRDLNDQLQEADQAKDRFLASMSHELRTPLNSILGFSGILLMEMSGALNEQQRSQIDFIQTSGKHLLSLINDILDLARIESGTVTVNPQPVSLKKALQSVFEMVAPLAAQKGLYLKSIGDESVEFVLADERSLQQILINLINNAIKFTDNGGITIDVESRNGFVDVSVTDTGNGISDRDQEKLFNGFVQLASNKAQEGTGLGLHLSQKLANLLGGNIKITNSEVGKGTTFTLTLPRAPNETENGKDTHQ